MSEHGHVHGCLKMEPIKMDTSFNVQEVAKYRGQKVEIILKKNSIHINGYIKTIDPLSKTVVLINFDEIKQDVPLQVMLISDHAIDSISLMDAEPIDKYRLDLVKDLWRNGKIVDQVDEGSVKERRDRLFKWIKEDNRMPIELNDDGSMVVASILTIRSPFRCEDCFCSNEIILNNIKTIINQMPNT